MEGRSRDQESLRSVLTWPEPEKLEEGGGPAIANIGRYTCVILVNISQNTWFLGIIIAYV